MAYDEDLREIDGQAFRNADDTSQITPEPNPGKFPWRKNVLTLLLIAYSSIILIFIVLVFSGMEPPDAYDKHKCSLHGIGGRDTYDYKRPTSLA